MKAEANVEADELSRRQVIRRPRTVSHVGRLTFAAMLFFFRTQKRSPIGHPLRIHRELWNTGWLFRIVRESNGESSLFLSSRKSVVPPTAFSAAPFLSHDVTSQLNVADWQQGVAFESSVAKLSSCRPWNARERAGGDFNQPVQLIV